MLICKSLCKKWEGKKITKHNYISITWKEVWISSSTHKQPNKTIKQNPKGPPEKQNGKANLPYKIETTANPLLEASVKEKKWSSLLLILYYPDLLL